MKRMLLTALGFMLLLPLAIRAQELKAPVHLRLATQDLGSAWYMYGANFATLWRQALPKGSTIDVLPYGGGPANSLLIDKGDAEIAISFTAIANWALRGTLAYDRKIEKITGLVGQLDRYYLGIVATKGSGVTSFGEALRKKRPMRIVSQPIGSTAEYSIRLLFQAYGLSLDEFKSWGGTYTPTSTEVAKAQMIDGKADVWIQVITAGHPAVSELAITTGLVFLPIEEEIRNKMVAHGYQETVLPAKVFKGQESEVPILGFPSILIADKDLKPEVAYALTKAIVENRDALIKAHSGFKDFKPDDAANLVRYGIPLHPGAEKYYREKGLIR